MKPRRTDTDNEWDTTSYDGCHSFVFEYGEDVVDLLAPETGERVLDLGCGTGHLTNQIAATGADVVGLDASIEMVAEARESYPDLQFVNADGRDFSFEEPFDAVFSNAVLHWISEQGAVLDSVAEALRPGGRFVVELGGTGNVNSIVDAVQNAATDRGYEANSPWHFPSPGEFAANLEAHGFEVRYVTLFDRPTELDGGADGLDSWLEMFGDSLLSEIPVDERDTVISEVEDQLRDQYYEEGTWIADYRRLRAIAIRTST